MPELQQDFLLRSMHMHTRPNTMRYQIRLFGAIRIESPHGSLVLTSGKAQSLLAYLALHPRMPHRREALADLLFAEAPPDRARRNLSDVLHRLRKTLGDGWLNADAACISLRADDDLFVDVWAFDALAASDQSDDLQGAVALYAGELAPEIYDDWIALERDTRRTAFLSALEKLSSQLEAQNEWQGALQHTQRLILADPLHEPGNHACLRLLGRLRRYSEAQAHYEALRQRLWVELGTEPLAETQDLVKMLMRERDAAAPPIGAVASAPFVGRAAERTTALTAVENVLRGRGGVLTIEGEPGIGKSRLAQEIIAGASWRGLTVMQGAVSEVPQSSPFSPLANALAPELRTRAAQLEALLPVESLAMLAELYPAWQRTSSAAQPRQSTIETRQAGQQFYGAVRALGAALAQLMPLMLVLDDMQWASPALWESVQALAQGFLQRGGLLLMSYRRPDIERMFGWDVLQAWNRAGSLQTLSLQPFNIDEVEQLMRGNGAFEPSRSACADGRQSIFDDGVAR